MKYVEVYLNGVKDLINAGKNVVVSRTVDGIQSEAVEVSSVEEVLQLKSAGDKLRKTKKTNLNEHSSRSHAILQLVRHYSSK